MKKCIIINYNGSIIDTVSEYKDLDFVHKYQDCWFFFLEMRANNEMFISILDSHYDFFDEAIIDASQFKTDLLLSWIKDKDITLEELAK